MPFRAATPTAARSTMPAATAAGGRLRRAMQRMRGTGTCTTTTPRWAGTTTVSRTALACGV